MSIFKPAPAEVRSVLLREISRLLIELRESNRNTDLNRIHFGKVLGAIAAAAALETITHAEFNRLIQLNSNAAAQARNELFSSLRASRHAA